MNKELRENFNHFIQAFEGINNGSKENFTILFYGILSNNESPADVRVEVEKLTKIAPTVRLLENLLSTFRSSRQPDHRWEPRIRTEGIEQPITLSPTFHIHIDDNPLLQQIEALHREIAACPIRYDIIINYIFKRAREEGYLDPEG